ncbi:MAG: fibronectin type III domain-containing protein, partial [bacterium F082]
MNRKVLFMFALLCAVAQGAWGWDGSGTSADPYLIRTSADWKQLADDVSGGNSYSGKFFEMAADIDAQGISVGTSDKPFSGTFSGGMHTLTYNRGGAEPVDDRCAPFIRLDGATIRDLKVTGKVYSSHKFAGGIASLIDGTAVTTISSCGVSSELWAAQAIVSDATFGGLVGAVSETCTATPVIENCTFTGAIQFHATCSGGLVGYTFKMPVTFDHCLYDPTEVPRVDGCATFVRTAPGVECTFKECYYTKQMGTVQGEAVFREVIVPEGCTYRFVSEPQVPFNGVDYYKSGTVIELSVPDDVDFDHWQTISDGCWISNPWQRSGLQTVRDIRYAPDFTIATTMPEAKEERKMDGTVYRYLYKQDYHLYISDEEVAAKRYYFDDKGEMFKWDEDGKHVWVTAVTGWVPGKIPSDGAQIHNDLSGTGKDYTLLGAIAPQAFKGCTELKTLYFKDTDANNFNARFPFDFIIGDKAFADCPNLTEIKMMQYTTKGENHWEALSPEQVTLVGDSVFAGSPQANFTVDASKYQDFLSSQVWKKVNNRILIYGHTHVDMKVNGAQYSYMRNTAGDPLKNNAEGHDQLMETLRYWNAD